MRLSVLFERPDDWDRVELASPHCRASPTCTVPAFGGDKTPCHRRFPGFVGTGSLTDSASVAMPDVIPDHFIGGHDTKLRASYTCTPSKYAPPGTCRGGNLYLGTATIPNFGLPIPVHPQSMRLPVLAVVATFTLGLQPDGTARSSLKLSPGVLTPLNAESPELIRARFTTEPVPIVQNDSARLPQADPPEARPWSLPDRRPIHGFLKPMYLSFPLATWRQRTFPLNFKYGLKCHRSPGDPSPEPAAGLAIVVS